MKIFSPPRAAAQSTSPTPKSIHNATYNRVAMWRLGLACALWCVCAVAHAGGLDLTGSYTWTDMSDTTGEVFTSDAQITGGSNGTFSWTWYGGAWNGNGTVNGTTWTLSGSSGSYSASWKGTISQSGNQVTLTGNWSQSDGQVGTTKAVGTVAADHLAFSVQPTTAAAGQSITPPVTVQILNAQNQLDTSATDSISLALISPPNVSAAALGGTTVTAAAAGVAQFSNLSVNMPGQGYTLVATDTNAAGASSSAFNIMGCTQAGVPGQLCVTKTASPPAATVSDHGDSYGLAYQVTLQNGTASALSAITITDTVTPAFNIAAPTSPIGTPSSDPISWPDQESRCKGSVDCTDAVPATITWSHSLPSVPAGGSLAPPLNYTLQTPIVTVRNGSTIESIKDWVDQQDGWGTTSATVTASAIQLSGGNLIFSDAPEFLEAGTTVDYTNEGIVGISMDDSVEGVLYKQTNTVNGGALTSSGNFRLYLNHENRTNRDKDIYFVLTNSSAAAVRVTASRVGLASAPGDPVAAGQAALAAYLNGNSASAPILAEDQPCTGSGAATSIPARASCAFFVAPLGAKKNGGAADVVNLIDDLYTSGPVQVGVVVVNVESVPAFESDPLHYHFKGAAQSTRNYLTDVGLGNFGETHVHGTFPYNTVSVAIPYDVSQGSRFGWLLGNKPAKSRLEYLPALDMYGPNQVLNQGDLINGGNYGVEYFVTISPFNAESGMATQVLLNPRGAGLQPNNTRNAFAAVMTTSAASEPFYVPTPDGNKEDNFIKKNKNIAVGVGYIAGNDSLTLDLIPPAGDATPVAVVLAPAYVKNTVTATSSGISSESAVKIVQLPDPNAN